MSRRRAVIEYGVAIDLVVVAAGVGLLYPDKPLLILVAFIAASTLSAWKGWGGAAVAIVLSALCQVTMFPAAFPLSRVAAYVAAAAVAAAAMRFAAKSMSVVHVSADPLPADGPVAAEPPVVMPVVSDEEARREFERRLEEKLASERQAIEEAARRELERDRAELQRSIEEAARRQREAEQERLAAERAALEREVEERLAAERRALEDTARQRVESERAELQRRLDEAIARERQAEQEKFEAEREALERQIREKFELQLRESEESARARLEEERAALQLALENAAAHHRETEEKLRAAEARVVAKGDRRSGERKRFEQERAELQQRVEEAERREREAAEKAAAAERTLLEELEKRLAAQRDELENTARKRIENERATIEREFEEKVASERAAVARAEAERIAAEQALKAKLAEERQRAERRAEIANAQKIAARRKIEARSARGILSTVAGWFGGRPSSGNVNLKVRNVPAPARRSTTPQQPSPRRSVSVALDKPSIVLLERRRAMADTVAPKLRSMGVTVQVVDRLVDAADEVFRLSPHAIFIDSELPDFEKDFRSLSTQNPRLPLFVTGRSSAGFIPPPGVRYAAFVVRPYDVEELAQIAKDAQNDPERFLLNHNVARPTPSRDAVKMPQPAKVTPIPLSSVDPPAAVPAPKPASVPPQPRAGGVYEVSCASCGELFDAMQGEWCSCLAKERTVVCTFCGNCFCKADASYKEKFWMQAPQAMFERKNSEARRAPMLVENPEPHAITRPLVLCVEDDEEIQHIVGHVCSNLGYGFIYAMNGQDGLDLARRYRPDMILSDAFMPRLDGREMCRLLREGGDLPDCRMVVMTGLYTDTKYRSEAVKRFHVDDYLAKPVSMAELVSVLQRHAGGASEAEAEPKPEAAVVPSDFDTAEPEGVHLADLLAEEANDFARFMNIDTDAPAHQPKIAADAYEICCHTCGEVFDAAHAEWCSCVGRDNTLVCPHCGSCFCKAPAAYKERFWMDAPPTLFERKLLGSKRHTPGSSNPLPTEVKRPLILLVEDDENVQLIVRTVVTSMGYGFIGAANGKEGLELAREYTPDLILSDAFMPKLDGREMCRLLKQDPATARAKAIIMTGLYTDRKYRNEALDYFRVDDYVAKPLAVDDLIRLFKKHLPQELQPAM